MVFAACRASAVCRCRYLTNLGVLVSRRRRLSGALQVLHLGCSFHSATLARCPDFFTLCSARARQDSNGFCPLSSALCKVACLHLCSSARSGLASNKQLAHFAQASLPGGERHAAVGTEYLQSVATMDKLRETLRDEHSFLVQFMLQVWRRCGRRLS